MDYNSISSSSKYFITAEQLEKVADAIRENCTLNDTKLSYPWGFIEKTSNINGVFENFINGTMSNIYLKVESLESYIFYWYSNLISINCPFCSRIGSSAFYRCSNLISISFPACTLIDNYAFASCSNLTSIKFPICTTINSNAFYECSKLTSIELPVCSIIGTNAFEGCRNLTSINFPACTLISARAFRSCTYLNTISFPVCTTINSAAFSSCYRLLSAYFLGSSIPSLAYSDTFYSTPIANFTSYTSGEYGSIFVRASMLEAFKSATNWTYYSDRIVGLTDEEIVNL